MHVRVDGDGPPLLQLHAGIADGRRWDPLVPLLPGLWLIRPGLRGFGETVARTDPVAGAMPPSGRRQVRVLPSART